MTEETEEPKKLSGAALGKFYTPGLQDELVSLVRKGNTRSEAAKRCKIAPRTFGYWMARGAANLAEFAEAEEREPGSGAAVLDDFGVFRLEIEAAAAQVQAGLKDVVFKRAMSDSPDAWKAAAWILERRFPESWGRRGPVRTEADDQPDDSGVAVGSAPIAQGLTKELRTTIEEDLFGVPRRGA